MKKAIYSALGVTIVFCVIGLSSVGAAANLKIINLDAYDIIYDSFSQRIYASVLSSDAQRGNTITTINPVTGAIENSVYVGSEPKKMAISANGMYVYVALDGSGKIRRYIIPSQTAELEFAVGSSTYYGTLYAADMEVQPGNPNVVAISMYRRSVSPSHGGVAIFDNGIKRPNQTPDHTGSNVIAFSDSPQILYGYNTESTEYGLRTMLVDEYGVQTISTRENIFSGFGLNIEFDDGFLFSSSGRVVDTNTMQLVGTYSSSGIVRPDSAIRRTFFANNSTIYAYNQNTFTSTGQETVPGISGSPRNLIRWGTHGLAFSTTNKQVVIFESGLVTDPPALNSLVIEGPENISDYKAVYKVIASFSDGVVKDVTKKCRLTTAPDTYASIDSTGTMYIFGTDSPGTVQLKAEYSWAGVNNTATKQISYQGTIPVDANLVRLEIQGPDQVLKQTSTQFKAIAFFDNNTQFDVTQKGIWTLSNTAFADISEDGLLTVHDINFSRDVVVYANFGYKNVELNAIKTIVCLSDQSQLSSTNWPMYQANPQHTGYLNISLDPEDFSLRWTKTISGSMGLNPVTAANGKVFVSLLVYFDSIDSLFTLDARDGEILWKKSFGSIYSVNPPSYGYGNVYIQTGNHGSDTYLRAYNADTGQDVFKSPHSAQWERYLAPTIYDGSVYVNGGSYGGMYGFNAFSGKQIWFIGLQQEDGWTPTVDGNYSYAFLHGNLYAINRFYGTNEFSISTGNSYSVQVPVKGNYNDIIVCENGALYCLDIVSKKVKWELSGNYSGMPSVAKGVIYAVNNGSLEAITETNGQLNWSWSSPEGKLRSPVIVTNSHVIACTDAKTYAIDILSRQSDWSYSASGYLALGNDTLYIAGTNGVLTAIATPEYIPANILKVEIQGPSEISESSTTSYTAKVYYSDGRTRDRSQLCSWSIEGSKLASVDNKGNVSVGQLLYPTEKIILNVQYTEKGITVIDQQDITVHIGCSVTQLLQRNLEGSLKAKQEVLLALDKALEKEAACLDIIKRLNNRELVGMSRPSINKVNYQLYLAVVRERFAKDGINKSVDNITQALAALDSNSPYIEDTARFREYREIDSNSDFQKADINGDGEVDLFDFAELSKFWLYKNN